MLLISPERESDLTFPGEFNFTEQICRNKNNEGMKITHGDIQIRKRYSQPRWKVCKIYLFLLLGIGDKSCN